MFVYVGVAEGERQEVDSEAKQWVCDSAKAIRRVNKEGGKGWEKMRRTTKYYADLILFITISEAIPKLFINISTQITGGLFLESLRNPAGNSGYPCS